MNVTHATQAAAAQADTGKVVAPRLATAAKQFESVLLGQWLQDAQASFASVPGGDEDSDSGGQQMQGFATQQLAAGLTACGGIGIAKLVQGALAKASEREQNGTTAVATAARASSSAHAMAAYATEATR